MVKEWTNERTAPATKATMSMEIEKDKEYFAGEMDQFIKGSSLIMIGMVTGFMCWLMGGSTRAS